MKNQHFLPLPANLRNDRRMKRAMKDLPGAVGYGIIVWLLERLRCEEGFKYPLSDIDLLADELNVSLAIMQTVISNYDFFEIIESDNGQMFISPLLMNLMQPYIKKIESNRIAGQISAAKKANKLDIQLKQLTFSPSDSTQHMLNNCLTHEQQKRIEEKREENNKNLSLGQAVLSFSQYKKKIIELYNNTQKPLGPALNYESDALIIQNGYIHNTYLQKDLLSDDAIDVWKALYQHHISLHAKN